MSGISVKLPYTRDDVDGVTLNKGILEALSQNLLNLFLTSPGERIMIPDFGIGLRNFLFEFDEPGVRDKIVGRAYAQTGKYIPQIELLDITFLSERDDPNVLPNFIEIRVTFQVPALGQSENLNITVDTNDFSLV